MEITFELDAFAKVILHAAKYPALPVNGLLIRKISSISENTKGLTCNDAVPLTHGNMSRFTTPMMEIALAQVERQCKDSKCEVVGYYQANQNIDDNAPDFIATRIMDKLHEVNPNIMAVMINNDELDSNLEKVPFTIYKFSDGKLKIQDARLHLAPDEQGSLSTVSALIQGKFYNLVVDFDNHLDNIRENYFTNPRLSETIQQFS